jgi:methylmalonyl-CoA/ethylmalonyl-CoA epimerase
MSENSPSTLIGNHFGQVAWVVRDIEATEKFFRETLGVPRFLKMENLRAQDLEGTYHGEPGNFEFHLYLTYSGETMLELIQPVSGQSIYTDFLEKNGGNGVQHIAHMVPESELERATRELADKGYSVVQTLNLPPARVAYINTYAEIGVMTEIIGVTEAGYQLIEQIKSGDF